MTMKTRSRYPRGFAGILAIAALFASVSVAQAQRDYPDRNYRNDVRTDRGYEQMRRFAHELDQLASAANRRAQAQQAGYRGFRRDSNFLRTIDNFARRVRQFRVRMDSYRTQPWRVDDEVERLGQNAREVQRRIERARFVDAATRRDWNRVVFLLDRVGDEYRWVLDNDRRYGRDGRYDDRYPEYDERYPAYDDRYGYENVRPLARELAERAARADDLASRYGAWGSRSELRDFREETRTFASRVESNRLSASALRSDVNRLLEEAQDAHRDLERMNMSRELSAEWDGIVRVLNELRRLVV